MVAGTGVAVAVAVAVVGVCGVPGRTSRSSRRKVYSSMMGTPSAAARHAFADPDEESLVTSALVCRLTEAIMFSPAATERPTSSARDVAVSPVMAIFIPCTSGPPGDSRPGLRKEHAVFGGLGANCGSCRGEQATSGNGRSSRAASRSEARSTPASTRVSSSASCALSCRTP